MNKERKSLEQMAAESAIESDSGITCPKCSCKDFRVYRSSKGQSARFLYKACRHCGHRVLTTSQTTERIIRDVAPHSSGDDDGEPLLLSLLG
jgi:DNA-directed RNA polymerase subunit RPC12/RpoP